jgi:hypothetical protein
MEGKMKRTALAAGGLAIVGLLISSAVADSGLSLEGISLLQSLPHMEGHFLDSEETRLVLQGIFNLAVLQQGLGSDPRYQKGIAGEYSQPEFGWYLASIFLADPEDCGSGVYREPLSAGGDIDEYEFELGERLFLTLDKNMGYINNLDWGISEIRRERELASAPSKIEEFILRWEGDTLGTVKLGHIIYDSQGNVILDETLATFVKGNPYPVEK